MIGREKPRTNARRLPPSDRADISGREEMRAASSHDAMEGVDSVLGEALEHIFHTADRWKGNNRCESDP